MIMCEGYDCYNITENITVNHMYFGYDSTRCYGNTTV